MRNVCQEKMVDSHENWKKGSHENIEDGIFARYVTGTSEARTPTLRGSNVDKCLKTIS